MLHFVILLFIKKKKKKIQCHLTFCVFQTLAIFQFVMTFFFMGFSGLFLMLFLLFTDYYYIPIIYFGWYLLDRRVPYEGGRPVECVRSWRIWRWYRDYFPISLVKTAELDPKRNYLLCLHPHGVLCFGAFCNFGTNATRFRDKFPGMRSALLVLSGHYQFPIYREYFMQTGKNTLPSFNFHNTSSQLPGLSA